MAAVTRVTYGAKRYLVTWNGITKKASSVEAWVFQGTEGYYRTVWAHPRQPGSLVAAVIATADEIEKRKIS